MVHCLCGTVPWDTTLSRGGGPLSNSDVRRTFSGGKKGTIGVLLAMLTEEAVLKLPVTFCLVVEDLTGFLKL